MCPPTSAAHSGTGLDRVQEVKMVTKVEVGEFQEPPSDQDVCERPTPKMALGPYPAMFQGISRLIIIDPQISTEDL